MTLRDRKLASSLALACGALISLAAFACGSSPAATETPVPTTPAPTPSPTATVTSTVTPTSSPEPSASLESLAVEDIVTPVCVPADPNGPSSVGTAPGPQATATAVPGERDPATVTAELTAYLRRAEPAMEHARFWETWLADRWTAGLAAEQQAALLHLSGIKMAEACNALAVISDVPPEAADLHVAMSDAMRKRLDWSRSAVSQLRCCGEGATPEIEADRQAAGAAFDDAFGKEAALFQAYPDIAVDGYDMADDVLSVKLAAPDGWFEWPDGLSAVLTAPPADNGETVASLGPESWQLGTSVRVRRLRNPGTLTAAEAGDRFQAIVIRQGQIALTTKTEVDGSPAVRYLLDAPAGWSASMTIATAGDFIYFIETGCSTDAPKGCQQARQVADSIQFTDS